MANRKIQYAFRPAKHIQRRMIVDTLRRLRVFGPLSEYQYIGMGGVEFIDFELVHRELGIHALLSIEQDTSSAARFSFNRPFSGIEMRFDSASDVLPDLLDEQRLRVVWLDYEKALDLEVLQDVGTCVRKLTPGSLLAVTVNAHPARRGSRRDQLEESIGTERIPSGSTEDILAKWGTSRAAREVLVAEMAGNLRRRSDGAQFEQTFNFRYSDGAYMLTWGGVLVTPELREAWDRARMSELDQVRDGEEAFEILVPVVTAREALRLNEQLPQGAAALDLEALSEREKKAYARLYRWYPPTPAPI